MENTNVITPEVKESVNLDIEAEKKKQQIRLIFKKVFTYIFLTIFAIFAIFPFYWMIITSLKSFNEYRSLVLTYFPKEIMWSNYSVVIANGASKGTDFWRYLSTTLIVGLSSTLLSVLVTILTAYAFARLKFKGREFMFSLLLSTMMIPGELFTITNYVTVSQMGIRSTYVVMIIPFVVSVFYIYLLRNAFKQIPDSLYQAAKVDGCGNFRYLVKVMIPLAGPTIISITLLKFIGTWNAYIWPRLVNSEAYQLLSNWVSNGFTYEGDSTAAPTLKMAAATMVTVPLLVLFLCFRKYIMRGVSRSGTKG